jgi:hypothetical protein
MKQSTIFHVPIGAFYSKPLYSAACHEWKGTGFGYLFLLVAVCAIPLLVRIQAGVAGFVEGEASRVVSQIPVLTFENGRMTLEEPQPYTIRDPDTGMSLVVIDTTGTITSLEQTSARALITETQALVQKSAVETRAFSFQDIESFILDQAWINGWLDRIGKYLTPVLYPFVVLFTFLGKAIQALVYAAIGLLFASLYKSRRAYDELLRIAVIAITPGILIRTLQSAAQVQIPYANLWFILCALTFLAFGVKAASRDDVPVEASAPPALPET